MTDPQAIRQAILSAPFEMDNTGGTPHLGTLYIPLAHRKALSRDAVLVVGARGVGKSFWTAALSDDQLRRQIGESVQELACTQIRVGYAANSNTKAYPDRDTFKQLVSTFGFEPYVIWRAVVLRWLVGVVQEALPTTSWLDTVQWVEAHPEQVAQVVEKADAYFASQKQFGLIVFDALDRTANDWNTMNRIVRGLLEVALWLRDFPRLRAKVFLRPDQMERTVTSFVDASKLLATRADLTWERHDLHAMMWQRLINAEGEHGECLRSVVGSVLHSTETLRRDSDRDFWILPASLTSETPCQRPLFEALAGDKMGKDARRGVPYVWSVSHLADGHGQTSPRSFLAAIHEAAGDSSQRYSEYPLALHYESIKRGIQKASQIRVAQVTEDDPWVSKAMQPLKGMSVPCDYEMMQQSWQSAFPDGPASLPSDYLPPQHVESWEGIRKDLERLGILITRKDGRIDMPDIYRVDFGLGRRGGVAPRKS